MGWSMGLYISLAVPVQGSIHVYLLSVLDTPGDFLSAMEWCGCVSDPQLSLPGVVSNGSHVPYAPS